MKSSSQSLAHLAFVAACTFTICATADSASAQAAFGDDPKKIMQAVEDRDTGDKMRATSTMTILSGDRKRVRVVQTRSIKFDKGTKQLMLFDRPADIRNTGLLTVEYDNAGTDDDQWLYLPSLRRTARISGGDRSGSFMGSDFTYADMTKSHTSDYDYKLIKSTKVGGEDCWLIESRPRTKKVREETGYVKSWSWISKTKLMPLQVKSWVREGKKIKYIKFADIKQIDNIWVAHKSTARTTRGKTVESTTVLVLQDVRFNDSSVSSSDFTQRRLEQGL